MHRDPRPDFYWHNGRYKPKCRQQHVPRFRCRVCGAGFSRQTFRADYCDNKPYLNVQVLQMLASGVGYRQTARIIGLSRRCLEVKARKYCSHLKDFHVNMLELLPEFPVGSVFQLDEMETFETCRSTRPLTLPVMLHEKSLFIVDACSAPIRPRGRMTPRRKALIQAEERRFGPRRDRSRPAILRVLKTAARYCKSIGTVVLKSDLKSVYPRLARRAFGRFVECIGFSSKLKRDRSNPLFWVNLTNAKSRDLIGRLRRRSWLVSKMFKYLNLQLYLLLAYLNYVRPRVNTKPETPAQLLGITDRPLRFDELITWRQDWKGRSIHPLDEGRWMRDIAFYRRSKQLARH